ncbi:MAG: very short patch repair endonuclease [Treponema sp.]|nr:very short patch repair endonuclease [Treponema sp.]
MVSENHNRGYQDTKPEVFFRKALWKWGVRYRKNVKLFGNPI